VKNPSASVAFMVHLRLTQGPGGADIVPVLWEDNYFSLLPGESRVVSMRYVGAPIAGVGGQVPVVSVDGFNVTPITVRP
jgi:exo-1,4-beta-D-glucosaminidase